MAEAESIRALRREHAIEVARSQRTLTPLFRAKFVRKVGPAALPHPSLNGLSFRAVFPNIAAR